MNQTAFRQMGQLFIESINTLNSATLPDKERSELINNIKEMLEFKFQINGEISGQLLRCLAANLGLGRETKREFIVIACLNALSVISWGNMLELAHCPHALAFLMRELNECLINKSVEIQNESISLIHKISECSPISQVVYFFPFTSIQILHIIINKIPSKTSTKSKCISLYGSLISGILGDKRKHIKEILEDKGIVGRNIIDEIQNMISGRDESKNESKLVTGINSRSMDIDNYSLEMDEKWFTQTIEKVNYSIQVLYEEGRRELEMLNLGINKQIIELCTKLLTQCKYSLQKSQLLLIKLLNLAYFSTSAYTLTEYSHILPSNFMTAELHTDIQDEFIYSVKDWRKIPLEIDERAKKLYIQNSIGLSWLLNISCYPTHYTEEQIFYLGEYLLNLMNLESQKPELIQEISTLLPIAPDESNTNSTEYLQFEIEKYICGRFSKLDNDINLYKLVSIFLSSLSPTLGLQVYNNIYMQMESILGLQSAMTLTPAKYKYYISRLWISIAIGTGNKEVMEMIIKFILNETYELQGGTINRKNPEINESMLIINDVLHATAIHTYIKNNEPEFKRKPIQFQNKILFQVLSFLSSPSTPIKFGGEICYTQLSKTLASENRRKLLEERIFYILDFTCREIRYSNKQTSKTPLLIITSLMKECPNILKPHIYKLIAFLILCFDYNYRAEYEWIINNYLLIFIKLIQFTSENIYIEGEMKCGDTIREILMRIRPLLGSHNIQLRVKSLYIFRESAPILNSTPLSINSSPNFSPEDPSNVTIPCALTAITFEFWDYFMRNLSEKRLPLVIETLQTLIILAEFRPLYFVDMGRFEVVWGIGGKYLLGGINQNPLILKIQQLILQFILKNTVESYGSKIGDIGRNIIEFFFSNYENILEQVLMDKLVAMKSYALDIFRNIAEYSVPFNEFSSPELRENGRDILKKVIEEQKDVFKIESFLQKNINGNFLSKLKGELWASIIELLL